MNIWECVHVKVQTQQPKPDQDSPPPAGDMDDRWVGIKWDSGDGWRRTARQGDEMMTLMERDRQKRRMRVAPSREEEEEEEDGGLGRLQV